MIKRTISSLRSAWTMVCGGSHVTRTKTSGFVSGWEGPGCARHCRSVWEAKLALLCLLLGASTNPENSAWGPGPCLFSTTGSCFVGAANSLLQSEETVFSFPWLNAHEVKLEFDKLYQKSPFSKNYGLRFRFLIWTECSCWVLASCSAFCKIQFIKHSSILKRTGWTTLPCRHLSFLFLVWASGELPQVLLGGD